MPTPPKSPNHGATLPTAYSRSPLVQLEAPTMTAPCGMPPVVLEASDILGMCSPMEPLAAMPCIMAWTVHHCPSGWETLAHHKTSIGVLRTAMAATCG